MFKSFLKSGAGNIAMVFALALPVTIGMIGAAVDMTVAHNHKKKIQDAADAAVLAATALPFSSTLAEREAVADDVFAANLKQTGNWLQVTSGTLSETTPSGAPLTFTYAVDAATKTSVAQIFGVNAIDQRATSSASIAAAGSGQGVELALAFDVTASMTFVADDGLSTSREQAYDAITSSLAALQSLSGASNFYISFMPIADRINIGTDKQAWMTFGNYEGAMQAQVDADGEGGQHVIVDDSHYRGTVNAMNWNGCAHPRYLGDSAAYGLDGAADLPYFLSDAPPIGDEGVPFRAMKESHKANHDSHYDLHCNDQALIGPTSDISQITAALPELRNAGTGRFDEAIAWSWRLLSPKWQGLWGPAGYPQDPAALADASDARRKIMLIFTDGHTTAYNREFAYDMVWGYNKSTPEQMDNIKAVCSAAKAQGIEIYIFHVLGNETPDVVDTFKSCVSDVDSYAQSVSTYYHQVSTFSDLTAGLASLQIGDAAPLLIK